MKKNIEIIAASDPAEVLLCELIAECRDIIREMVRPALASTDRTLERDTIVNMIGKLGRMGSELGETIVKLRGGEEKPELRQRIMVERIEPVQRLSTSRQGEG